MSPKIKSIAPMKPKPSTLSNKSLILTSLINEKNWDCLLIRKPFRGQTTDHVAQILDSLKMQMKWVFFIAEFQRAAKIRKIAVYRFVNIFSSSRVITV